MKIWFSHTRNIDDDPIWKHCSIYFFTSSDGFCTADISTWSTGNTSIIFFHSTLVRNRKLAVIYKNVIIYDTELLETTWFISSNYHHCLLWIFPASQGSHPLLPRNCPFLRTIQTLSRKFPREFTFTAYAFLHFSSTLRYYWYAS